MKRIASLFAAALLFAGAATQAQTLRIGIQSDPDALDPATSQSFWTRIVFASLCDKLIDVDTALNFVPQLATEWAWQDSGRSLVMKLRPGVVFHDGTPLDAEAVRVNLDRYRSAPESRRRGEMRPVSGVGDLRFYAGAGGVGRHCDCFFFPNRARWDWLKLAALICPRPLLLVNSDNDSYFPMAGNDRYANRLERLYSLFGAGDRVDAVVVGPILTG